MTNRKIIRRAALAMAEKPLDMLLFYSSFDFVPNEGSTACRCVEGGKEARRQGGKANINFAKTKPILAMISTEFAENTKPKRSQFTGETKPIDQEDHQNLA
ncbi:MAG: hypothetical protein ACREFD_11145 [Stellaceae bacterium]